MKTYRQVERELDTASRHKYHLMVTRNICQCRLLREGMEHSVNWYSRCKGSAETTVDRVGGWNPNGEASSLCRTPFEKKAADFPSDVVNDKEGIAMETSVVSISRTLAAGGEEVGRLVAGELGFRYVDDEVVMRASAHAGVSPATIAQVEHSRSLSERIVEAISTLSVETQTQFEGAPVSLSVDREHYQGLIQWVVQDVAREGQVVFVAHGTSITLANMSGNLRVLITASPEVRSERLMGADGLNQRQARKAIQDSDRERQTFFRRFSNLRQELPIHYDLVVNTERLTVPEAAKLVVLAARG